MTTAQVAATLSQADLLIIAALRELVERLDADVLDEETRNELATTLFTGAAAIAKLAAAVTA
jgi:hypothetical protein